MASAASGRAGSWKAGGFPTFRTWPAGSTRGPKRSTRPYRDIEGEYLMRALLVAASAATCLLPAAAEANALKGVYEKALTNDMTYQAAAHAHDAAVEARPQA